MNILIVGINYQPEMVGVGVYTAGMVEALESQGHVVTVVTAPPHFPVWRLSSDYRKWWYSTEKSKTGTIVRSPIYVPKNPSGMRRIFHYISFALSSFLAAFLSAIRTKPDVVIAVAPSLISAPGSRLIAWIFGARSWLHIQDFEVEAAMATDVFKQKGRRAGLARIFERWVLRLFDRVSTISPAMVSRLCKKGVPKKKVYEFRNWSDMSHIGPLATPSVYRRRLDIQDKHVALYSGSIAKKQGIEIIIEAANLLKQREDICFVICGDGHAVPSLRARVEELDLKNIHFLPLQPKKRLGELLGLASIHILPQIAGAADLVLPSKLTNMLASGRPVVATADPETGLAKEVEGCGLLVAPGDQNGLAEAVERLVNDDSLRKELGDAALRRCSERWNRNIILNEFCAALCEIGEDSRHGALPEKQSVEVTSL